MPKLVLCLMLFICVASSPASVREASATAGWADVDITPPLGLPMGGRGPTETVGKTVRDPLHAQVLYLKDSKGTGFALVSFDLVGMSHEVSDRIRTKLVQELGVDWDLTLLNVSHTHSGPQMNHTIFAGSGPLPKNEADYFDALTQKIVMAARAARKAMSSVKVEVFNGKTKIAINRRGRNAKGEKAGLIPDINGNIDDNVWVMKLTPEDGKAPAVIFSAACHPVIVYGFAGAAISHDFPGFARKALRDQLGAGVHTQFVQGFAGDVRPRRLADVEKNHFRSSKPGDAEEVGAELANDVLAAMKTKPTELKLNIAGCCDRPFFPKGKLPPRSVYEEMLKTAKNDTRRAIAEYWLARYESGEGFAKGDAWSVGVIRLSDKQWICHMAGEPCVEWRPKIAKWLKGRNFVPFGYSEETITYLPTEEMLPEGGYEVDDANHARNSSPGRFGEGLNEAVHQSIARQLSFIDTRVK